MNFGDLVRPHFDLSLNDALQRSPLVRSEIIIVAGSWAEH